MVGEANLFLKYSCIGTVTEETPFIVEPVLQVPKRVKLNDTLIKAKLALLRDRYFSIYQL